MKTNKSKIAFICFHRLFRIGTFQRVTGEKTKKLLSVCPRVLGCRFRAQSGSSPSGAGESDRRGELRIAEHHNDDFCLVQENDGVLSSVRPLRGPNGRSSLALDERVHTAIIFSHSHLRQGQKSHVFRNATRGGIIEVWAAVNRWVILAIASRDLEEQLSAQSCAPIARDDAG
jgi:hypothetical protein